MLKMADSIGKGYNTINGIHYTGWNTPYLLRQLEHTMGFSMHHGIRGTAGHPGRIVVACGVPGIRFGHLKVEDRHLLTYPGSVVGKFSLQLKISMDISF